MVKIYNIEYLTLSEIAKHLELTEDRVRTAYIKSGKIKAVKIKNKWLVTKKHFLEFLQTPVNTEKTAFSSIEK